MKKQLAIIAIVLLSGCGYNRIQTLDEQVNAYQGNIETQLQLRAGHLCRQDRRKLPDIAVVEPNRAVVIRPGRRQPVLGSLKLNLQVPEVLR